MGTQEGSRILVLLFRPGGLTLADIMKVLYEERKALQQRLSGVERAIEAMSGEAVKTVKKASRKISASARKKMSLAAKARWAEIKKKAK